MEFLITLHFSGEALYWVVVSKPGEFNFSSCTQKIKKISTNSQVGKTQSNLDNTLQYNGLT